MDSKKKFPVEHFKWAVVRLATFKPARNSPVRLLLATVTLLVNDRPPPPKMEKFDRYNIKKSESSIFFRRTLLTAQDAIEWYRSLDTDMRTPKPSRKEDDDPNLDGKPIAVSNLIDDPLWPSLGLPIDERLIGQTFSTKPLSFLGDSNARLHRRFGKTEGFEIFSDDSDALSFVSKRLHINLKVFPEYLGSLVLVVPDPLIRKIDNFLIPAGDGRGERIFYRFIPRPGQSLKGLSITTFDEQCNLLSGFDQIEIPPNGILDLDKTSAHGAYGYVITHPEHGVLSYRQPTGFLRTMNLNMGVVNEVRKVRVPIRETKNSDETEYRTTRVGNYSSSSIGENPTVPNVNLRVGQAIRKRQRALSAANYDQRWFADGSREEAMAFLRERVGRARVRIIVADPYFGVLQVPQFLLAITSDTVKIEILTSRLAFDSGTSPESEKKDSTFKRKKLAERLTLFKNEVERIRVEGNSQLDVMVLPGSPPPLHDRFLVVDDDIWFLGGSLNSLGDRASLIIKLPNPDEVMLELRKMFKKSKPFEVYYLKQLQTFEKAGE